VADGPFKVMYLALELLIVFLELLKLFRMGLRKLFDQSGPTVCTTLCQNVEKALFNDTSLRAL
jgi:hypothetical protein